MHSPAAVVSRACQIPPASRDMSTPERASAMCEKVVIIPRMVPSSPMSGASRASTDSRESRASSRSSTVSPARRKAASRFGRGEPRSAAKSRREGTASSRAARGRTSPVRIASSTRPGKRESGNGHPMNTSARSTTIASAATETANSGHIIQPPNSISPTSSSFTKTALPAGKYPCR